jgi:hypothetical protein
VGPRHTWIESTCIHRYLIQIFKYDYIWTHNKLLTFSTALLNVSNVSLALFTRALENSSERTSRTFCSQWVMLSLCGGFHLVTNILFAAVSTDNHTSLCGTVRVSEESSFTNNILGRWGMGTPTMLDRDLSNWGSPTSYACKFQYLLENTYNRQFGIGAHLNWQLFHGVK